MKAEKKVEKIQQKISGLKFKFIYLGELPKAKAYRTSALTGIQPGNSKGPFTQGDSQRGFQMGNF